MTAVDLLDRLTREMAAGRPLDWRQTREEIYNAHEAASTEAERVVCLSLFNAVMDCVERQGIEADKLIEFRKIRQKDYNLLLVKEAMVGRTDGNVPPDRLAVITRREVAAGRMASDDGLHKRAVAWETALAPPPVPSKTGFATRLASWFK